MAGSKPTSVEKAEIKELISAGASIQEIKQRLPHLDGRSIAGMIGVAAGNLASIPRSSGIASPIPSGGGGTAPAVPTSVPVHRPKLPPPPVPSLEPGIPPSVVVDSQRLGFTPKGQQNNLPSGFVSTTREYFFVKKLDPPGDGIVGRELPPFTIKELWERYPGGHYEVQRYVNGRIDGTYEERVAPKPGDRSFTAAQPGVVVPSPVDPANTILRAAQMVQQIQQDARTEGGATRAVEAQVLAAREAGKAQVEVAQTSGIIDVLKEQLKKKEIDPREVSIEKLFSIMKEDREAIAEKHRMELETMRERAKLDRDTERERQKAEMERFQADLDHRERMQQGFMEKLQGLDSDRQRIWKDSYDKMVGEVSSYQESLDKKFEDQKEHLKEMAELQRESIQIERKHLEEVADLKKMAGGADKDIEMAKLIKDGVVGGLDRIGHRVDLAIEHGIIKGGNGSVRSALPAPSREATQQQPVSKEERTVDISKAIHEPWFQKLQDEIALTVTRRKEGKKLHGSLLGQTFLDEVNEDKSIRRYLHFLCSRTWKEVLKEGEGGLKEEHKAILMSDEAEKWYDEFSFFLTEAWNNSVGVNASARV